MTSRPEITPTRLVRIRELFDAALEMATEERIPYLMRACGGDITLRFEVESLLAALDRGGDTWERPAGASPRSSTWAGMPPGQVELAIRNRRDARTLRWTSSKPNSSTTHLQIRV